MFCRKCGRELEQGALFCIYCGTKVESEADAGTGGNLRPDFYWDNGQKKENTSANNKPVNNKPVNNKPVNNNMANNNPEKNKPGTTGKKTAMIVLIVIICLLTVAVIAGGILLFLKQQDKSKQVEAFEKEMNTFEKLLEDYNYSSIQGDVQKLLRDCETAVKEKAVDSFETLRKRMSALRDELQEISEEIGSLEELKSLYEARLEKYEISEELQELADQALDELSEAIDSGDVKALAGLKEKLERVTGQIRDANLAIISGIFDSVADVDTSEIDKDAARAMDEYVDEIQELIDAGAYKDAIAKARELLELAVRAKTEAEVRRQESLRESEEESRARAEEEARQSSAANNDGYICPGSDSRYLTERDLMGLSDWGLLLARNEIYARHGRLFKDASIQDYFDHQAWYDGYIDPDDFDASVFNAYEKANIQFIKEYED